MNFIYNVFFIKPINLLMPVVNLVLPKMRERELYQKKSDRPAIKAGNQRRIWFHASSMGEFEQAKPIIEIIKHNHPEVFVICTFYSPSGYNNQNKYEYADYICYMPLDTVENANKFIEEIKPDLAVFVRYDMWLNHLNTLNKRNIPTYLICATPPSNKIYLSLFNGFLTYIYNKFDFIFTMTPNDSKYFESLRLKSNIIPSSDSRFDRIIAIVNEYIDKPLIPKHIFDNFKVLVAGSSWEPDEKIISSAVEIYNQTHNIKIKIIYAPHEPTDKHIEKLMMIEPNLIKLSELESIESEVDRQKLIKDSHIVVDSIGKLLKLYSNADLVYVGGAFGAGVHSVTEPAGYGVPIMCGKGYKNSPDARRMVKLGLLKPINNINEMLDFLEYLSDYPDKEKSLAVKTKDYIFSLGGTSKIIANHLLKTIFSDSL